MKTTITFFLEGECLSALAPSRSIAYHGAVTVPDVGDRVARYVAGEAEFLKGKVLSRQFSYFDDEARVMLTLAND